jgi:hypothetical protein
MMHRNNAHEASWGEVHVSDNRSFSDSAVFQTQLESDVPNNQALCDQYPDFIFRFPAAAQALADTSENYFQATSNWGRAE